MCGDIRNAYVILLGNPEEKERLQKELPKKGDNIAVDWRETGCMCVKWINLARGRVGWWNLVLNNEMKFSGSIKMWAFLGHFTTEKYTQWNLLP
jgi:hypothetical protein